MENRPMGMRMSGKRICWTMAAAAAVGWCSLAGFDRPDAGRIAAEPTAGPKPAPVEESMHEFMEYVFEPAYKRLKVAMAAAPADNAGWKAIKGDSLPLAEAGNLLLTRLPDDDAAAWAGHSVKVRDFGVQLYFLCQRSVRRTNKHNKLHRRIYLGAEYHSFGILSRG